MADIGCATSDTSSASGDFIQVIKGWLQICDNQHAFSVNSQTRQSPSWLIDTECKCIVRGTNHHYLALSYTWHEPFPLTPAKSKKPFQLGLETLSMLQQPGCLSRSEIANQLPKVIKDAIEFVPLIGHRYLWVDRLCIVQGESSTQLEVMRMDETYSGAALALVAAASYGLYGNREMTALNASFEGIQHHQSSDIRSLLDLHSKDASYCRDLEVKAHYHAVSQTRWATRGWTYQEHILSNRLLFFLDDRIFWECEASVWDMYRLSPQGNTQRGEAISDMGKRLLTTDWPDFSLYVDLVCPYNGRSLTYSGDGLSACSGMLNRLTRAFTSGFIFGLPRAALDHALLWQPLRRCYRREELATGTDLLLPSWSWCGWQCYLDPRSLLSGTSTLHDSTHQSITSSWVTESCVEWSILTLSGRRIPISDSSTSDDILPQLACRTERACFHIADILGIEGNPERGFRGGWIRAFGHPVLTDNSLNEMMPVVVLRDKEMNFSGLLKMTDDIKCQQGDRIELIAISKGTANRSDIRECLEERVFEKSQYEGSGPFQASFDENGLWIDDFSGHDVGTYQITFEGDEEPELKQINEYWGEEETCRFYNVLWVVRTEDVHYRVACGRIAEKTWIADRSSEIDVVLG
ncbi:hypothetical protein CDV36_004207 [Fusarium kuroshium]|uniref:Heterokaryon incompatibility domain-containing protein n=1 Tax=Fusarium kuroshium TaxID=2010991 RepID=A0A3M2SEW1_9HYPO|nr:hypothetical protein CDV36_004207 [Fusarium kuroshium]